jgi:hypothetical protein
MGRAQLLLIVMFPRLGSLKQYLSMWYLEAGLEILMKQIVFTVWCDLHSRYRPRFDFLPCLQIDRPIYRI